MGSRSSRPAQPPCLERHPSEASASLEVRGLTATYRENGATLTAIANLSLTVAGEEFVALIGPSGSGKSTLLDIISGLIAPGAGEVRLGGHALAAGERLGRSAHMRQRDLLLPWRTALENAALALEVAGVPRRAALERARMRLPEFGLAGFADAYPAQLSGGMRQRVAFLRTVLAARPLLLLDEPFGALDALTRAEMQNWLLALWERERRAVLLVTHDVEEALLLADDIYVLSPRPGRIVLHLHSPFARPRTRELIADPAFGELKMQLLAALGVGAIAERVPS